MISWSMGPRVLFLLRSCRNAIISWGRTLLKPMASLHKECKSKFLFSLACWKEEWTQGKLSKVCSMKQMGKIMLTIQNLMMNFSYRISSMSPETTYLSTNPHCFSILLHFAILRALQSISKIVMPLRNYPTLFMKLRCCTLSKSN